MREQIIEFLGTTDPLFFAAALASLIGISIYWLYGGFIDQNYNKIKWFRRLLLPHVTRAIRTIDEENKEYDLSCLYVETKALDREHVFDLYIDEDESKEQALSNVGDELISHHFRPEVILASLAENSDGNAEDGNFVLTAPTSNHPNSTGIGRLYDIIVMLTSKYQLHVRIFHDADKHRLRFYAHHELNPYNPFFALDHFEAKEFDTETGVRMFGRYKEDLEKHGVELIESGQGSNGED